MTRDDIICEADAWLKMNGRASDYQTCFVMALFAQHISALVAAAEREACAKVAEDRSVGWVEVERVGHTKNRHAVDAARYEGLAIAGEIRLRGGVKP